MPLDGLNRVLTGDAMRPDFLRYRDYVIDSFNKDKPYDQFLLEQLAGDELVDWRNAEILTPEIVEKLLPPASCVAHRMQRTTN